MNSRENLLSLYRRVGYEKTPVYFVLSPYLEEVFKGKYPEAESYSEYFEFPMEVMTDPGFPWSDDYENFVPDREFEWNKYFDKEIKEGSRIDIWGIVHEPGSKEARHMTHMRHPLANAGSLEELKEYPWPEFEKADWSFLKPEVENVHKKELACHIWMECTIWETAWYLRGMENLMMDMATADNKAVFLLDKITDLAVFRAREFANSGVDILALGDDIGMQESTLMSVDLYRQWLKPRLTRVIREAKDIKPDIIIQYHSCGYVEPFIDDLIEAGVDVLNPVQPECMGFKKIHDKYGDRISFNGTLGTQKLMPFGSTEDIKKETVKNLKIAGDKGGLLCCPTHMLEPEVPWENIEAYVEACRNFK